MPWISSESAQLNRWTAEQVDSDEPPPFAVGDSVLTGTAHYVAESGGTGETPWKRLVTS